MVLRKAKPRSPFPFTSPAAQIEAMRTQRHRNIAEGMRMCLIAHSSSHVSNLGSVFNTSRFFEDSFSP